MESLLILLILLEVLTHETTQTQPQNQQTVVLKNCVEDAQEEHFRCPYAGRHSSVEVDHAVLPSGDGVEGPAP